MPQEYRFNMEGMQGADPHTPFWVDEGLKVWIFWAGESVQIGDAVFGEESDTWQFEPDDYATIRDPCLCEHLDNMSEELDLWISENMGDHWPTLVKAGLAASISCLHCGQHVADITKAEQLEEHSAVALYQEADTLSESWVICKACARFGVARNRKTCKDPTPCRHSEHYANNEHPCGTCSRNETQLHGRDALGYGDNYEA